MTKVLSEFQLWARAFIICVCIISCVYLKSRMITSLLLVIAHSSLYCFLPVSRCLSFPSVYHVGAYLPSGPGCLVLWKLLNWCFYCILTVFKMSDFKKLTVTINSMIDSLIFLYITVQQTVPMITTIIRYVLTDQKWTKAPFNTISREY